MDISQLPVIGWAVIAFMAVLVFIVLLLAIRKGVKFGKDNNFVSVGGMDKKLDEFKAEIAQKEKARQKDEELRKQIFRSSIEIDEKTRADNRRIVRRLIPSMQEIFNRYGTCEFSTMSAIEIIRDELLERIDYNCVREQLSLSERSGYITDILQHIKDAYEMFLLKIPRVPCSSETFPAWSEIQSSVEVLVNTWADETTVSLKKRMHEKIDVYTSERESFLLPENVDKTVDYPIRKNKRYIKKLGG